MTNAEAIEYLEWIRPIKPYSLDRIKVQQSIDLAIKALEDRPQGKWLKIHNPNYSPFDGTCEDLSVCPFCGYKTSYKPHKFCPGCGARMEEDNEDTN